MKLNDFQIMSRIESGPSCGIHDFPPVFSGLIDNINDLTPVKADLTAVDPVAWWHVVKHHNGLGTGIAGPSYARRWRHSGSERHSSSWWQWQWGLRLVVWQPPWRTAEEQTLHCL